MRTFEDPEHGALLYVLRADAHHALVVYDHDSGYSESREGPESEVPLAGLPSAGLKPASQARLLRAPASRHVLSLAFSGEAFDPSPVMELGDCALWPDDEELWKVPWGEVEQQLTR